MVKGKLILICQYGGVFETNDDGTLSYAGGEANAINISDETEFSYLKLELAEMCNLDYSSVSLKYFLPGNKRNLIILKNDKDLKRLIHFHCNSVTADIFVLGKEGFNRDALNMYATRESGAKLAGAVNCAVAVMDKLFPVNVAYPAGLAVAPSPYTSCANPADSLVAINTTAQSPSGATNDSTPSFDHTADDDSDYAPRSTAAVGSIPTEIQMRCTPADTVKKRRRAASRKNGRVPTSVAVPDDGRERRPQKRSRQHQSSVAIASERGKKRDSVFRKMDFYSPSRSGKSDDDSLEKQVVSWQDCITGVGQEFRTVKEFRDALQKYAITNRFVYRLKKNDSSRASGRCVVEGCSWRIHASWVPADQAFKIKKFNDSHTCGGESWKKAYPGKNWLVGIIKDRLRESPHKKPKEIANNIFQDFGLELNYTQVWRGIEDAREQLQGSYKEAYSQLPLFCEKMVETNPGSVAKLITDDDKRFQRLFVSFHATIHGFLSSCRPLLFLEATSLNSKYQESLLTATAIDGNDGLFPVAFAIVDDENDGSWHWFLEHLKSALSTQRPTTFVSYRENNLKKLVLEVFENAHYGYSMNHLVESFMENLKGPFHGDGKGSLLGNFVAAAHALRYSDFINFLGKIKEVSSEAYNWVVQIEPEHWASLHFTGEPFNDITEDVAEIYTKLIEEVRETSIIQKIEAIRCMMIELINKRRVDSGNWSGKLTPSKEKKLLEETLKARGLLVFISSETLYEVHDDSTHVVNLSNWHCTCLEWKRSGFPCRHAIAVFNRTGRTVYEYCPAYFTVENFRSTYSETINPVPGIGVPVGKEEADPDTVFVLPPCSSRPLSQFRKKRIKKVDANKRTVFCSRCKSAGHNKSTCKSVVDDTGLSNGSPKAIDMLPHEVDNAGSSQGSLYTVEVQPWDMGNMVFSHNDPDKAGLCHDNRGIAEVQSCEIDPAVLSHGNLYTVEVQSCSVDSAGSTHGNSVDVEVLPCDLEIAVPSKNNVCPVEVQSCEINNAISGNSSHDGLEVQPCEINNAISGDNSQEGVEVQPSHVDNAGLSHSNPDDVEAQPYEIKNAISGNSSHEGVEVQPSHVDNAGLSHSNPDDAEVQPCEVENACLSISNPNALEMQPSEVDNECLIHIDLPK